MDYRAFYKHFMLFYLAALGITLFILLFSLTIYSAVIGAPYFKTPKKAIREIFELAGIKPGDKLYDLGAGDGKILIIAEKEFRAQGIGFELSPTFWLLTKIHLALAGAHHSQVYCRNFYNQNLSEADVIFCFLSIHAMERLKPKFEQELKPGTKIISYAFSLRGWQPKQVIAKYPGKIFLYQV